MSGKFGWERENAKDASKRGRRPYQGSKPSKRPQQSNVQFRSRCPKCGSFRVRKVISTFVCQSCGLDTYQMQTVKVRIDGGRFTPIK